ncbi:hypothetical protein [Novipirellula caenicola]|uniref:Uncharacterized protein n=1 Tax=Novipirellula caenicola TaxID=1536901 RepID=A0ABP9VU66_9BACT
MSPKKLSIEIEHLVGQFYSVTEEADRDSVGRLSSELASFESLVVVPPPFDQLLDHNKHMTVTVEAFHGQKVDVVVHRTKRVDNWYSREITLVTQNDKKIVQYGIVRLNVDQLSEPVWSRIESETTPLGRVLIEHNVLRQVQLCGLWRVEAGPSLASIMQVEKGDTLFGRTALIYCDGDPAIELLEIVAPVPAD